MLLDACELSGKAKDPVMTIDAKVQIQFRVEATEIWVSMKLPFAEAAGVRGQHCADGEVEFERREAISQVADGQAI